jgi:hypothetical protein
LYHREILLPLIFKFPLDELCCIEFKTLNCNILILSSFKFSLDVYALMYSCFVKNLLTNPSYQMGVSQLHDMILLQVPYAQSVVPTNMCCGGDEERLFHTKILCPRS